MSNRTGIMLCYPMELRRLERWLKEDGYTICQPKFDGDRGRALLRNSGVELLSSEAEDRNFALPHIKAELERILPVFHARGVYELDGEFYNHGLPHEKIHGICARSVNRHPDYQLVEYHIFDHISTGTSQLLRLNELYIDQDLINGCKYLKWCPSSMATSTDKVLEWYQTFVDAGYEGIICRRPNAPYVRKRSNTIMKYKPKRTDTYAIVGYKEEHTITGEPKNTLGALELVDPEGNTFWVSAGLTHAQRKQYWEARDTLPGRKCTIHYQAVTDRGVPKFVTDLEIE